MSAVKFLMSSCAVLTLCGSSALADGLDRHFEHGHFSHDLVVGGAVADQIVKDLSAIGVIIQDNGASLESITCSYDTEKDSCLVKFPKEYKTLDVLDNSPLASLKKVLADNAPVKTASPTASGGHIGLPVLLSCFRTSSAYSYNCLIRLDLGYSTDSYIVSSDTLPAVNQLIASTPASLKQPIVGKKLNAMFISDVSSKSESGGHSSNSLTYILSSNDKQGEAIDTNAFSNALLAVQAQRPIRVLSHSPGRPFYSCTEALEANSVSFCVVTETPYY